MNFSLVNFIGSEVTFGVSDPWAFYTSHGDQEFSAIVKAALSELLLVELTRPLEYKGVVFKHLVASARHSDKSVADIVSTEYENINCL